MFLMSAMVAVLLGGVARTTFADPPFAPLKEHDWFAIRDINDGGKWDETAAYLQVKDSTNGAKIYGTLWIYKKSGNRHRRQPAIEVTGRWIKQNGKRRTAKLRVDTGMPNPPGPEIAAISYWLDRGNQGTAEKQLRVVLRLFPSFVDKSGIIHNCDEPPDDDILEEEDELDPGEEPEDPLP